MQKTKNKINANKFTVSELLDINACTRCGICTELCSAYAGSNDIEVSPATKLNLLKKRLDYKYSLPGRITGQREISEKELAELEKAAFQCTMCGRCEVECPVNIGLKDIWFSLRDELVEEGRYPQSLEMLKNMIMQGKNISFETNSSRIDWINQMDNIPENKYVKEQAEVIYFVGCVSSYSPRVFKIPRSMVKLFQYAGVDFALMGEDEWCCGYPLLGAGFKEEAMQFAEHNINSVNQRKAKYLVTSCPTCFHVWKHIYPEIAKAHMDRYTYPKPVLSNKMNFSILQEVQFLLKLVREGKFKLNPINKKITYHDPCDLGRSSGIYEEPRELIKLIPRVEFIELQFIKENAKCCGGGGNVEAVSAQLSENIAKIRAQEIIDSGADIVVSACQQCVRTIAGALKKEKSKIKAMDISELLFESIEGSMQ